MRPLRRPTAPIHIDRKSTRLNSSHLVISYAVFCLKKKTKTYRLKNMRRNRQTGPLDRATPHRQCQSTHLYSSTLLPCTSRSLVLCFFFFFNDTATTEIYTLSLHDALPISSASCSGPTIRSSANTSNAM